MYLLATIQSSEGQSEHFNLMLEELETALEALNVFVVGGYQILQASIYEEDLRLQLPVEALDGTSLRQPLADLQHQWQALLAYQLVDDQKNALLLKFQQTNQPFLNARG